MVMVSSRYRCCRKKTCMSPSFRSFGCLILLFVFQTGSLAHQAQDYVSSSRLKRRTSEYLESINVFAKRERTEQVYENQPMSKSMLTKPSKCSLVELGFQVQIACTCKVLNHNFKDSNEERRTPKISRCFEMN